MSAATAALAWFGLAGIAAAQQAGALVMEGRGDWRAEASAQRLKRGDAVPPNTFLRHQPADADPLARLQVLLRNGDKVESGCKSQSPCQASIRIPALVEEPPPLAKRLWEAGKQIFAPGNPVPWVVALSRGQDAPRERVLPAKDGAIQPRTLCQPLNRKPLIKLFPITPAGDAAHGAPIVVDCSDPPAAPLPAADGLRRLEFYRGAPTPEFTGDDAWVLIASGLTLQAAGEEFDASVQALAKLGWEPDTPLARTFLRTELVRIATHSRQ